MKKLLLVLSLAFLWIVPLESRPYLKQAFEIQLPGKILMVNIEDTGILALTDQDSLYLLDNSGEILYSRYFTPFLNRSLFPTRGEYEIYGTTAPLLHTRDSVMHLDMATGKTLWAAPRRWEFPNMDRYGFFGGRIIKTSATNLAKEGQPWDVLYKCDYKDTTDLMLRALGQGIYLYGTSQLPHLSKNMALVNYRPSYSKEQAGENHPRITQHSYVLFQRQLYDGSFNHEVFTADFDESSHDPSKVRVYFGWNSSLELLHLPYGSYHYQFGQETFFDRDTFRYPVEYFLIRQTPSDTSFVSLNGRSFKLFEKDLYSKIQKNIVFGTLISFQDDILRSIMIDEYPESDRLKRKTYYYTNEIIVFKGVDFYKATYGMGFWRRKAIKSAGTFDKIQKPRTV